MTKFISFVLCALTPIGVAVAAVSVENAAR